MCYNVLKLKIENIFSGNQCSLNFHRFFSELNSRPKKMIELSSFLSLSERDVVYLMFKNLSFCHSPLTAPFPMCCLLSKILKMLFSFSNFSSAFGVAFCCSKRV